MSTQMRQTQFFVIVIALTGVGWLLALFLAILIRERLAENFGIILVFTLFAMLVLYFASRVFRGIAREREVDKAKTEFVSVASHQLRTPLSAIKWYTEMLMAGEAGHVSETQRQYVEEIRLGTQRMVELVNALLDVSRIELGTFTIEPETTNVVTIAQEVVKDLEPEVFQKHQKLIENYATDIPEMKVDPRLARIIFQNLLSNAVKYTPEEGSVTLSLKRAGEWMQIEVTDTGYGIPADQRDKIFTKMFRADNIRQYDTSGTGLGLYIVKAVVEATGGTIWFESQEKIGTTFFVRLPLSGMNAKLGARRLGQSD